MKSDKGNPIILFCDTTKQHKINCPFNFTPPPPKKPQTNRNFFSVGVVFEAMYPNPTTSKKKILNKGLGCVNEKPQPTMRQTTNSAILAFYTLHEASSDVGLPDSW